MSKVVWDKVALSWVLEFDDGSEFLLHALDEAQARQQADQLEEGFVMDEL
jgi:hypothetical protein